MMAAKFEPTNISPLTEAFERHACKPLFSFLVLSFFFFLTLWYWDQKVRQS